MFSFTVLGQKKELLPFSCASSSSNPGIKIKSFANNSKKIILILKQEGEVCERTIVRSQIQVHDEGWFADSKGYFNFIYYYDFKVPCFGISRIEFEHVYGKVNDKAINIFSVYLHQKNHRDEKIMSSFLQGNQFTNNVESQCKSPGIDSLIKFSDQYDEWKAKVSL